ncbi:MAG: arginine--tRNA ligase [Flavobacteriales bacterium]|nr:arginine--tRNA ligase [Flavobacteriales bacterium]
MDVAKELDQEVRSYLDGSAGEQSWNIQWQKTRKDFKGEMTLVTFPLTKALKKSPEQIGEDIGQHLKESSDIVADYNVVKGFLNLELSHAFWVARLKDMHDQERYGMAEPDSKDLLMVEYSSPNTNKPLHLGHLRNNFLGWSVSEILKAHGHPVKKVQIINDRGIHICKSMYSWSVSEDKLTPESSGIKGDLLVGKYYVDFDKKYKAELASLVEEGMSEEEAKKQAPSMLAVRELLRQWEEKDPETRALWNRMNEWVYTGWKATYDRMGVSFDKNYYESETYLLGRKVVLEGVEKGIFSQDPDGSIWVDLTDEGLDRKILQRSDGTTVYMTQDIGTAIMRFEENPGLAAQIYTVGNEQEYHFKVLFLILDKLGYSWAKNCHHLSYGMVELPQGKMKTREGTVVDADDLMEEMVETARATTEELGKLDGIDEDESQDLFESIGLGALKYFLLKVDPRKRMMFNPEESIDFTGNTAPFIQYTHARIKSILRRYKGQAAVETGHPLHEKERDIIVVLNGYPSIIEEAAEQYSPALIANYIYDLVKTFNHYYQSVPILSDDDAPSVVQTRIAILETVARVISSGMRLLGVRVPEQM